MVWALLPVDSIPGEDKYYIFTKGRYKVGRKGCDVVINKDKGVSRIHAEIVVDAMASLDPAQNKYSNMPSKVRLIDNSKYGTFIKRDLASKIKIHEFPNKETTLEDGDLVSFGTGSSTYRFCFVPLIFFACCLEPSQISPHLQKKISAIGACITHTLCAECTHVLVDKSMPVKEDLIDAIVAKKPLVLGEWIEFVAEKSIQNEIPSYISYLPTLTLDRVPVKIADPKCRENCLEGYTFLLDLSHMYKFGDRLQLLLEVGGAKVLSVESFYSSGQGFEEGGNNRVVRVIPIGSSDKLNCKLSSPSRINEMDLIFAVLSGHMDPSVVISPSILVSSSCSTDETVVADSDVEVETVTSTQRTVAVHTEDIKYEADVKMSTHNTATKTETDHAICFRDKNDGMKATKIEESESRDADVIYSQDLIVRNATSPVSFRSTMDNGIINFKCFRKTRTPSGNSFNNLIPFSKYPYKDFDYENGEVCESMEEEKKRKQMEAIAEDLFNNEKGKRRAVAGSLRGIRSRG
ncbi:nibrin homolog isoform X2 [Malania oleifera]|uniref:nibrin homolog isoform X2 n=1 Tax=Malania oleifera TaxID=397392 RepID=UPI0025AE1C87|nr:nibrin homolog isoform X2 [Malania oleifera]